MTRYNSGFEVQVEVAGRWVTFTENPDSLLAGIPFHNAEVALAYADELRTQTNLPVRVWDLALNVERAPETAEQKSARESFTRNQAERKERERAEAVERAERSRVRFEAWQAERDTHRATLSQQTIEHEQDFDNLLTPVQDVLVEATVEAYTKTDEDGYGDEGEGYDGEAFVRNLLAMGWKFDPAHRLS